VRAAGKWYVEYTCWSMLNHKRTYGLSVGKGR
jgi:hypothetical protein